MTFTLAEIAEHLGAELHGDGERTVARICPLDKAEPDSITFLTNQKYREQLVDCSAVAVLLHPNELEFCQSLERENGKINALVLDNPYLGYAKLAQLMNNTPAPANGISPSAFIDPTATVPDSASVGPNAVVEAGAVLGENVEIGPGSFVGKNVVLGDGTRLWANVSIYHDVKVGKNCLFQSCAVVGSEGFGYATDKGEWVKIPQLGSVRIGDRVEIGSNTSIDRGALDDTVIEDGVIIDNQCQIAHNCYIGKNTAFAGGAMVAGSTHIGANCHIGGKTGIAGHIKIADGVVLTAYGMVIKSIDEPGLYSGGLPTMGNREWRKVNVRVRQLDDMAKRLRDAEKQLKQLKQTQQSQD